MAILDAYPGLTTKITVDAVPLAEYNDEEAETSPTETTKYIEARSGPEFVIETSFKWPFPTTNGVQINASIDGIHVSEWSIKPELLFRKVRGMKGVSFSEGGRRYLQNFRFAELNIVEEIAEHADIDDLRNQVKFKGCIEVSYRWITNVTTITIEKLLTPEDKGPSPPILRRQLPMIDNIPEKALKGDTQSLQAILGDPKPRTEPSWPLYSFDFVDREPFGIMRFKYRSRAALKAMRIIVDEEPQNQTESRTDVEQRTTQSPGRRVAQTKQENDGGNNAVKLEEGDLSRVKRERNAREDIDEDEDDDLAIVETRSRKRPRKG